MREEVEFLRRRSRNAYSLAREAFERGDYDWAIFLLEQSLQLLVKYYLADKLGHYPRSHSISKLLEEAAEVNVKFREFLGKYRDAIGLVEDSYILSRYIPRSYAREEVENKFYLYELLNKIIEDEAS